MKTIPLSDFNEATATGVFFWWSNILMGYQLRVLKNGHLCHSEATASRDFAVKRAAFFEAQTGLEACEILVERIEFFNSVAPLEISL